MNAEPESQRVDAVWRLGAAIGTVAIAAALFGFIIMPLAQPDAAAIGPLAAICRGIGLRAEATTSVRPVELKAPPTVSQVAWTRSTLATILAGDRQKGQQVAQQCTACHGEHGIIDEAQAPDLAPAVIPDIAQLDRPAMFKQLSDFRSGSRTSDIMGPIAQTLGERDMIDVIAYFAAPSGNDPASLLGRSMPSEPGVDLVERGIPARAIPPCTSCHRIGAGGPIGTPALSGQRAAYLEQQLKLFRTGERGNDIYGSMRQIAHGLSDAEIAAAVSYYAAKR